MEIYKICDNYKIYENCDFYDNLAAHPGITQN